jgi:hypothetical protein
LEPAGIREGVRGVRQGDLVRDLSAADLLIADRAALNAGCVAGVDGGRVRHGQSAVMDSLPHAVQQLAFYYVQLGGMADLPPSAVNYSTDSG